MITTGPGFISWNGQLYDSDLIQATIRPYTKHVGKLRVRHLRQDAINPDPRLRFLLKEPNELMTMQKLLEKVVWQLKLNGNAFVYVQRDTIDDVVGFVPLQPINVEVQVDANQKIYLKFYFADGTEQIISYRNIIHLRDNFNNHNFFGDSPAHALTELLENIGTTNQGIRSAIKDSLVARWIVKINNTLRKEDLEKVKKEIISTASNGIITTDARYDVREVKENSDRTYIPDSKIQQTFLNRVYSFFGTNENIVNNTHTEEQFSSWYESEIHPILLELTDEFTRKYFSRRERGFGNEIIFSPSVENISVRRLNLTTLTDRGIMSLNEYREALYLPPMPEDRFVIRREYGNLDEVAKVDENGKAVVDMA